MSTPRKKTTTSKITLRDSSQKTANTKVVEVLLLVVIIYIYFAVYEAVINPFLWAFDSRERAGTYLLIGFSFIVTFNFLSSFLSSFLKK